MNGVNGNETGETAEAASPGGCPTGWQGGPGRHPATDRMKWNRDVARSKKTPNWKTPGPDGVQGYWLRNLTHYMNEWLTT